MKTPIIIEIAENLKIELQYEITYYQRAEPATLEYPGCDEDVEYELYDMEGNKIGDLCECLNDTIHEAILKHN